MRNFHKFVSICTYNIIYYCDVVFIIVVLHLISSVDIGSSESISKPNKHTQAYTIILFKR